MCNFVPNKVFLRGVLLHYFNMKKTVSVSNHILVEVYGEHALTKRMCQAWFTRFESGNFNLEDEEMETSLDEDSSQTQEEVAKTLEVNHQAISHCLMKKITHGLVPIQARDYTPVPIPPPKKVFLHRVLFHYFNMKKDVVYSNQILKEVYGDQVPGERTCYKWFKEFKKGNFELVERRVGSSKKFEDEELNLLLKKDSSQTQEELAKKLGVSQRAISYRLKAMGMIQKVGK